MEVSDIRMVSPGVNWDDHILSFNLYGAGLGLKYYLTPRSFFVSGSLSLARLNYQSMDSYFPDGSTGDTSHWGAWARFAVGREWPVTPNWSVGMAGELQIGRMGQGAGPAT